MELKTAFRLELPVESSWPLLIDLPRVAACMPGVEVESADESGLHATMRTKVGPVTAAYRTTVSVDSLDEAAHTAVLRVSGRELRGPGTLEARVTAALREDGDGASDVTLTTQFDLTGKVAQVSGGVMAGVADRLLQQFAARLEEELAASAPAQAATAAGTDGGAAAPPQTVTPVDLGPLVRAAVGRRIAPAAAAALLVLAALLLMRRR